jgi:hypothetical protein
MQTQSQKAVARGNLPKKGYRANNQTFAVKEDNLYCLIQTELCEMKFCRLLLLVLLLIVNFRVWASNDEINFHPIEGVNATVEISDGKVSYAIVDGAVKVDRNVDVDTESKLHLSVGDYKFDGTKGFSISYVDEGMEIYEVYRVFSYSKKLRIFEELSPACSDEFLNLKVDENKKILTSTYFLGNEPKICVTKFGK